MVDVIHFLAKKNEDERIRINESISELGMTLDFEVWAKSQLFELGRDEDGYYYNTDTYGAFDGWVAATKALLIALPQMSNEAVHAYVAYLDALRVCTDSERITADKKAREDEYREFCERHAARRATTN